MGIISCMFANLSLGKPHLERVREWVEYGIFELCLSCYMPIYLHMLRCRKKMGSKSQWIHFQLSLSRRRRRTLFDALLVHKFSKDLCATMHGSKGSYYDQDPLPSLEWSFHYWKLFGPNVHFGSQIIHFFWPSCPTWYEPGNQFIRKDVSHTTPIPATPIHPHSTLL
jgi:hypothetical protein